jgi:hypothetical protein
MIFLKKQIPEYRNLTRQQKKTINSIYFRKYRSESRLIKSFSRYFVTFMPIIFVKIFIEQEKIELFCSFIVLLIYYFLLNFADSIWHANNLAKMSDFIELSKDSQIGF